MHLGIEEIEQETENTGSGELETDEKLEKLPRASLSVTLGRDQSKMLDAAFKAGVTTAISSFRGESPILGYGTAFRTGAIRRSNAFIDRDVMVHAQIGKKIKKSKWSTISSQIETIRLQLSHSDVAVKVRNSDRITELVNGVKMMNGSLTIVGGDEAWHSFSDSGMDFQDIEGLSVVLSPARCVPSQWFNRRCILGGVGQSAVARLIEKGINVGVSTDQDNFARGLIWEAGWAATEYFESLSITTPVPDEFAVAKFAVSLATWNIAKAFKLTSNRGNIQIGEHANFVVYDGVPGTFDARVLLVVDTDVVESSCSQN